VHPPLISTSTNLARERYDDPHVVQVRTGSNARAPRASFQWVRLVIRREKARYQNRRERCTWRRATINVGGEEWIVRNFAVSSPWLLEIDHASVEGFLFVWTAGLD
jgi:hypothetical protein